MEVNSIEIFLVSKQSVSGWSQTNIVTYESKIQAEVYVISQKN